ncbi:MAG: hypothetical protein COA57_13745 [Flavobacteriales bacterium]|nr:MAG: hypothetical protein COA57_13745 [Flavobacteriales bacterium]
MSQSDEIENREEDRTKSEIQKNRLEKAKLAFEIIKYVIAGTVAAGLLALWWTDYFEPINRKEVKLAELNNEIQAIKNQLLKDSLMTEIEDFRKITRQLEDSVQKEIKNQEKLKKELKDKTEEIKSSNLDEEKKLKAEIKLLKEEIERQNILIETLKNLREKKENIKYADHIVSEGESLYAISKMYNVSLERIFLDNPFAKNGIKVGQKLKIQRPKAWWDEE